jgi:hypothetical protein
VSTVSAITGISTWRHSQVHSALTSKTLLIQSLHVNEEVMAREHLKFSARRKRAPSPKLKDPTPSLERYAPLIMSLSRLLRRSLAGFSRSVVNNRD